MYLIEREPRTNGEVLRQRADSWQDGEEQVQLEYLTFPMLEQLPGIRHLFTTRTGGVSNGMYQSMNLSFTRGDDPASVLHNYERIAHVLHCGIEDMVASKQTHTTNIRRVTGEDRGKGIIKPRDYDEVDGLVTDETNIVLVTYYADCVPLYFVDPVHGAIGLAHSGWRGTVQQMGRCMVERMGQEFGSVPQDIYAAIGPSICQDCYEVSKEVADAFRCLESCQDTLNEIQKSGIYDSPAKGKRCILKEGKIPGKYQLDLWLANLVILHESGIPLSQIQVTDLCTCHNPEYLFSHRASQGRRGNLAAFLTRYE